MLRMAGNHLKPEEVWKDFSLETSKGAWTGQDLDFRLWASVLDRIDFYCFKPPNLWYILYCSSLNLGIEESAQNVGDLGSIPESGRSHREGNGYPFRYSCLENSMTEEPGGLQSWGHKESNTTEQLNHHQHPLWLRKLFLPLYPCRSLCCNMRFKW